MTGLLLLALHLAVGHAPCIRPLRAGTQVQGDVRVCPGRYRVADPSEQGVLIAAATGTRIDLSGVVLESGDSIAARYVGRGIASSGVDAVTVLGGTIRGYRFGIRLEGGRSHRISGTDLSRSRARPVVVRAARATGGADSGAAMTAANRVDPARADSFEAYGGGVYLKNTDGSTISGIIAHNAQNAIVLSGALRTYVADNDLTGNAGWTIALWRAAHNIIVRNQARGAVRCGGGRDCGAAAILLREGSDSNLIAENDLAGSDRGVLILGGAPFLRPSVANLVHRNDATAAAVEAFADVGGWGTTFLDNRADSAVVGLRLDGTSAAVVRGNVLIGTRRQGIVVEHGSETTVEANVLLGGGVGIRAGAPRENGAPSRGIRIDDNVLAKLRRGIVLERTTLARVRGNLLDGVGIGLAADSAARGLELSGNVFLRAGQWFIDAPELNAGGNYWGATDAAATATKLRGKVSLQPWRPASAAGY